MKTDFGLVEVLLPKDARTFLDVGGSDGETLYELGIKGTILDFDKGELEKARKYGHKTITFDLNRREKFPLGSNSFDAVLCSNCLEHVVYPEHVIREIHRVTKRYAIFIVPNDAYRLSGRIRTLLGARNFYDTTTPVSPHIQFFDYKTLEGAITKNGFFIRKEIVTGKPGLLRKNMSGSWSFLCTKKKEGRKETIRQAGWSSWHFR